VFGPEKEHGMSEEAPAIVGIAALAIDCAGPEAGEVPLAGITVRIDPGDLRLTLRDNGRGSDLRGGDGIFSSFWTPAGQGTYTLRFRHFGASYTVTVSGSPPVRR